MSTKLAEVKAILDELVKEVAEEEGYRKEIVKLKREKADLEIERDRETETNERERREVEHMVGLERKRQEFETEQAKREAVVAVREENLQADRERFEQQMRFTTDRFEQELKAERELMQAILKRLPDVTARIDLDGHRKREEV